MGEYAEEAIQAGLCEDYRKDKCPYSYYNNDVWEDVTGKQRLIRNMDSLHICFVMNYILLGYCNVKGNRCYLMGRVLANRGFMYRDLKVSLEGFKLGTYTMYDGDSRVDQYYKNLLRKYPDYDWSPLASYMYWK